MALETVPEQIRAAAAAARDLGGQVSAVPLDAVAGQVSTAMPASESAAAGTTLAGVWDDRIEALSDVVDSHGTLLGAAATAYEEQENLTRDGFARGLTR